MIKYSLVFVTLFFLRGLNAEPLFIFNFGGDPGPYTVPQWQKDWPRCQYENGISEGRGSLVSENGENWLRVLYPKGNFGSNSSGAGWRFKFASFEAVELSYKVRFGEDFDFVKGGKLPGLCGGPKTITGGDPVNGLEGFSARLMWRKGGRGEAYVYHVHKKAKYGDSFEFPDEFRFKRANVHEIRIRVDMNKAGKKDGQLRVWIDGDLLVERINLQWRKKSDYGVDSILFNTFHGGGDAGWAPDRDVWADFAGFKVLIIR